MTVLETLRPFNNSHKNTRVDREVFIPKQLSDQDLNRFNTGQLRFHKFTETGGFTILIVTGLVETHYYHCQKKTYLISYVFNFYLSN